MKEIEFDIKNNSFEHLFHIVSQKDVCIIGDKEYGKTTLLSKFFESYKSYLPAIILDSATEHGNKSLINQIKNRLEGCKQISIESEDSWNIKKINKNDIVLVDVSKYLEDSFREKPKENKMIYEKLIDFTIEEIYRLNTELVLITDETKIGNRTRKIISRQDKQFFLLSSFHEYYPLENVNTFEYKINLVRK